MAKADWATIISWIGVATIVIWAILKSVGVIKSPTYQEMIPFFGAAATFGGLITNTLNTRTEIKDVKVDIRELREKLNHLDKDVEVIKEKLK